MPTFGFEKSGFWWVISWVYMKKCCIRAFYAHFCPLFAHFFYKTGQAENVEISTV